MRTLSASSEASVGASAFKSELILRFGYGAIVPWVTRIDDVTDAGYRRPRHGGAALAGHACTAKISRRSAISPWRRREEVPFVLSFARSHQDLPEPIDVSSV